MEIRIWGARGSIPAPGPETLRYGGNTSCVEVRTTAGDLIILDAGTGIRPLGAALGHCRATVLLSHYHWDHIQGLPFFGPAYDPASCIRVWGPPFGGEGPRSQLEGQMSTPYFPAPPSQLKALQQCEPTPPGAFCVGGVTVQSTRLSHPGITLGYRLDDGNQSLVYLSDNEVDCATPEELHGILALAAGADLLLHDCQYTEQEYAGRHGWGHSTPRQTVRIALEAGVKRLVLFHHDPSHGDEQVDAIAAEAQRLAGSMEVLIGGEGDVLSIGPTTAALPAQPRRRTEPPVQHGAAS